jgi:putative oxidoreductase
MKLARFLLRLVIGGYFVGHGTQKLFGWFGGGGIEGTAGFMESLGLRPGKRHATAAGLAETAGGTGVLLGAATPFASSALISVMLTAIHRVHLKNGPFVDSGGFEYPLVMVLTLAMLNEVGPGAPSVDRALGIEKAGTKWALLALLLGVIGAEGAHAVAEGAAAEEDEPGSGSEPAPASEPASGSEAPGSESAPGAAA